MKIQQCEHRVVLLCNQKFSLPWQGYNSIQLFQTLFSFQTYSLKNNRFIFPAWYGMATQAFLTTRKFTYKWELSTPKYFHHKLISLNYVHIDYPYKLWPYSTLLTRLSNILFTVLMIFIPRDGLMIVAFSDYFCALYLFPFFSALHISHSYSGHHSYVANVKNVISCDSNSQDKKQ